MSQSPFRAVRPLIATAVAMAMFMGVSVASAAAAEITSVSPNPVKPPTTVSVEGSGFGSYEAKNIAVGICTEQVFNGVPACGAFANDVSINGSGIMTASIGVTSSSFTNLHAALPEQPPSFDCEEVNCVLLVANHVGGGKQEVLDFEGLVFE